MEQLGEVQHRLTKNSVMHVWTKRTRHCVQLFSSNLSTYTLQPEWVSSLADGEYLPVYLLTCCISPGSSLRASDSLSDWTDAHRQENVTVDQKRAAVHLKGHQRRRKVFSSALTLAYCNFPTMLCMYWEIWIARKSCSFFCLNLLSGKKKRKGEASSFCVLRSLRWLSLSLCPQLIISFSLIIFPALNSSYLSFNIPSLPSVCLSLSVNVYSEQIRSYQTASRRWLMSPWVSVCVWEAWGALRLIFLPNRCV